MAFKQKMPLDFSTLLTITGCDEILHGQEFSGTPSTQSLHPAGCKKEK